MSEQDNLCPLCKKGRLYFAKRTKTHPRKEYYSICDECGYDFWLPKRYLKPKAKAAK